MVFYRIPSAGAFFGDGNRNKATHENSPVCKITKISALNLAEAYT